MMQSSCGRNGTCTVIFMTVSWVMSISHAAETPVPSAAAGILAQMNKEIVAAKNKAVVSLEKVLKESTKKGDLAGAIKVKEAIDQLKAEIQTVARSAPGAGNAAAVVGRWRFGDLICEFRPDFSAKQSQGVAGKWQVSGRNLEVTWDNGFKYRLAIAPDGLFGIQRAPNGQESDMLMTREN